LSFVTHNTQLYAIDKTILQQFLVISIYCCFVFLSPIYSTIIAFDT
jgi:hypothetical protein